MDLPLALPKASVLIESLHNTIQFYLIKITSSLRTHANFHLHQHPTSWTNVENALKS